jgi:hypothetical protein
MTVSSRKTRQVLEILDQVPNTRAVKKNSRALDNATGLSRLGSLRECHIFQLNKKAD